MRIPVGAMVLALLSPAAAAQQQIELSICHEEAELHEDWRRVSLYQVARVFHDGSGATALKVRRAVCNETMPDTTCAAIPNHMFCRQEPFTRMNRAASWYAVRFVLENHTGYEGFRLTHERPALRAFRYAECSEPDPDVSPWQGLLRDHLALKLAGDVGPEHLSQLEAMGLVQDRIVAFNMAAIVGHESYHVAGNRCPLAEPARSERSGLFSHILRLQTSDELFCAENPDPNEINADLCAMRHVEGLHGSPLSGVDDADRLEDFAQRAASDMIAFQTLTGFRTFSDLPRGAYVIPEFDQYLNPVYRLTLLAGAVSTASTAPALCGDASGLFVHGVQTSFQTCAGDGQVSDELLAEMPPGVETSWNGAPWTTESFSCLGR